MMEFDRQGRRREEATPCRSGPGAWKGVVRVAVSEHAMNTISLSRPARALLFAAALAASAPARADAPPSCKEITAALQPFVDSGALAGAVTLVADKDKVLSLDAVGYADVGAGRPMRTDALFWIA
jgi:CubicO group peptidase (beta-lactamase class C family)